MAARANYLSSDRGDVQFAVKELCRGMSKPTKAEIKKIRRLARYLIGKPRVVMRYKFQKKGQGLRGYSDSDWAGCRRTAKSTSGGALMRGSHCLKTWSSTQKSVALSSGEAELIAAVKTSTKVIGILQLAKDWGEDAEGEVFVDSSAAIGMVRRKGNAKMRHVRVGMFWIQEQRESGALGFHKVSGLENPADLMTKYLSEHIISKHMEKFSQEFHEGRAPLALKV